MSIKEQRTAARMGTSCAGRQAEQSYPPWSQSTSSHFGLSKMSNEIYTCADLKCYSTLDFKQQQQKKARSRAPRDRPSKAGWSCGWHCTTEPLSAVRDLGGTENAPVAGSTHTRGRGWSSDKRGMSLKARQRSSWGWTPSWALPRR